MRANSLSDVKIANKNLIYQCIRDTKQITMAEIEYATHLSHPTATSLVRDLENEGRIIKVGVGISNGGRSPALYSINAGSTFAMGIDMEFPRIRMAICDLEGNILCSSNQLYPVDSFKDQVISMILSQAGDLIAESKIDIKKLLGIGVGVPGVIDQKNKLSIILERIQGWENVPIGSIIEEAFQRPVYICNDVDLLSLAERKYGNIDSPSDMLYIAIRHGIGMAIWTNGNIFSGEGGNAGRLGHMLVNTEGPACKCGSKGCLGMYTGERAMFQMYHKYSGKTVQSVKEIIELADQGDASALITIETTGHYLGIGIVNVANLFDISHVMISASFDLTRILKLIEPVLAIRKQNTLRRHIYVQAAKMEESKYAMGGCLMVLNTKAATLNHIEAAEA